MTAALPAPRLLVALCTHNPRRAFIERTVAALREQTLPVSSWDFLLVDNASTNGVPGLIDLSWHPSACYLLEATLGISAARLRAYAEAANRSASILLFVDDDTVLARDYLETGLGLGARDARLGCWGGQLLPEYEIAPPEWLAPFAKYLAIFPLAADLVTEKFTGNHDALPPTAGLFVRGELARDYRDMAMHDPLRLSLGEQAGNGMRGEDTDLTLHALDRGYRVGRFKALSLTHIMPKERLTLDYMTKLVAGIRAGTLLLDYLRGQDLPPRPGLLHRLRQRWQCARLPGLQRRIFAAELRGDRVARTLIEQSRRMHRQP